MRLFATAPLVLYPFGCVVRLNHPPESAPLALWIAGLAPIMLALLCFALITPTYFQRVNSDNQRKLDEYEIDLRRRAHTFAYQVFVGFVMLGLFYLYVVTDAEKLSWVWTPSTEDHWKAILWGVILYSLLLPTAYLAWTVSPPPQEDDA